eukprot:4477624-Prymnesium_polylepis.1
MPPLGKSERQELERLRGVSDGVGSTTLTEDEAVGEMDANESYFFVKEGVEAEGDDRQDSLFWKDNYGKCVAGEAR